MLKVEGQQRFADVKARMAELFQHHDVAPALREQGGNRGTGGAAANHQCITSGFCHRVVKGGRHGSL